MNISKRTTHRLGLSALLFLAAGTLSVQGAWNEDEWYDPTDWFDGNNIEYDVGHDYDMYDYDYNDGYDYTYDWTYWDDYYDDYSWNDYDSYSTWDMNSSDTWDNNDWSSSDEDAAVDGTVYSYTIWVPATTQSQSQSQSSSQGSSATGAQSGQQDQRKPASLSGTIAGLQSVNLERASGAKGTFTLAKVELDNGDTTVVNLGRQSQLEDVNVKKGDTIKAIGQRGAIDGDTVFVAQKLQVNGKEVDANPAIQLKGEQMAASRSASQTGSSSGQSTTSAAKHQMSSNEEITGQVAKIEQLKAKESPGQHTLLSLTLEDGTNATVDLGPGASPGRIGLEEGDSVTVRGHRDTIGGRSVIVAELMRIDGEKVDRVSNRG